MANEAYNPFYLRNGIMASNPVALVNACFDDPNVGVYHLMENHFEPWLSYIGRPDLAELASQARTGNELKNDRQKLDWFLERSCFERRQSINSGFDYLLHLPHGRTSGNMPLILFLHGVSERGSDLSLLLRDGLPARVARDPDFPFILVAPQCPNKSYWNPQVDALDLLLEEVVSSLPVERQRIYLTGLSMGGGGAWLLAGQHPEWFAALVPICGAGNPNLADKIKDIPTWVFHGAKDTKVSVDYSEDMVRALQLAGGNVKFTVYPEAGHDSWTQTYANPQLYAWLLSNRKKN